jgi:hypothetical protein
MANDIPDNMETQTIRAGNRSKGIRPKWLWNCLHDGTGSNGITLKIYNALKAQGFNTDLFYDGDEVEINQGIFIVRRARGGEPERFVLNPEAAAQADNPMEAPSALSDTEEFPDIDATDGAPAGDGVWSCMDLSTAPEILDRNAPVCIRSGARFYYIKKAEEAADVTEFQFTPPTILVELRDWLGANDQITFTIPDAGPLQVSMDDDCATKYTVEVEGNMHLIKKI